MNNAGANDPAIVDNDGNRFVDADDVKDGFQVNLSTGETFIEVATESEDSNAFEVYEVYVTRAAEPDAAPTASNNTVTTAVDTAYAFTATDFNFADDNAGDTLASVKITTLESAGDLDLDGSDVARNDVISRADIDGGKLTFTPASGASGDAYATFGFKVSDGHLESTSAYTMTVDVNTLPTAANSTVTTAEDTNHVFVADDFNFSDDDAGDTLASVKITTLATAGRLKLVDTDVRLNQVITKTQIDEGKLKFVPDADANGAPYTTFGFKVSDGDHESASAYTMTVDVTPVNDAPTGSDNRVTTGEDEAYTFTLDDFGFMDVDGGSELESVKITTLETAGRLLVDGNDVTRNRAVSRADIDGGKLTFTPASGASGTDYATFQFKVSDSDDESVDAYTMTIDVTAARGAVTDALVSNTGRTQNRTVHSGDDGNIQPIRRAQQFRTGPGGYVLTSVVAALGEVGSGAIPKVSLYSDASGQPGTSLHVLNNPAFRDNRNNTFTVPGKAILRANTNYWVVFENDSTGSGASAVYEISATDTDREDPGAAGGWSLADTHAFLIAAWTDTSDPLRIAIQGRVAGNNATLSALQLVDASNGSTLGIGFRPDKTEYRKTLARHRGVTVDGRLQNEITVIPTLSDSRASFVIREQDGSRSVDANPVRPGHQVMLTADGFGNENKFRVWVKAEDGTTRKSYTVRLDRELRALRVGIHQTPNSTVEQGDDVEFEIRVTDPDPGDGVNLAAIGGTVKIRVAIECEKRNHGGSDNDYGIRNRLAECRDLTLLGTRGGDSWGFSKILTISDSALVKRTNAGTGVETGTMTLRVGTEPDTIQDDGGNENQNFQENFAVRLRLLSHTQGGAPSHLIFRTGTWFSLGSIRLAGHLNDECEHIATDVNTGCAVPASEHQVAEPLTAAFQGVPVSHDGSSAFTLRLAFSEAVEISPEDLRDHALSATGGTISGVTRVDDAKDLFEVTVTPAGEEAVSVALAPPPGDCTVEGAVCTAEGTALAILALTQVRGPGPGLTVADAEAKEGEDDALDFVVTLDPPATETVTVAYATMDGTATAPDDYASKDGTLTFAVTGNVAAHVGGVQASLLASQRLLYRLHRAGLAWGTMGSGALCGRYPMPIMKKSQYRWQMTQPVPAVDPFTGCNPTGRSSVLWETLRELPVSGENFGYLLWKKRNCCLL